MDLLTIAIISIYVVCLWGYHYLYFFLTERKDVMTQRNKINQAIHSWFDTSLKGEDHLLVIHQLRNVIMAVTFLATAAVLLLGLIFGLTPTGLPEPLGNGSYALWLIIFTLIYSFFHFLLCLRHFTRVTFLVRSAPEKLKDISGESAETYLANLFIRGNREYTLGRRSMLYGIVALTWLLNPWVFLILTVGMTSVFIFSYDF
ncbi:MAG: DUF599 domain-containing protein [Candidatus Thermoplasmatota archaeon]|nr:DUF599 domain-containing protein [Candidatus Thermoplasmatota archaeon]MBS3789654.1 DUF599 domain-containing protein [Candidatus Thermoplasmatota archaeon]